jgi:hypothetical protein
MQELPQAAIFDLLTPSSSPTLIAHHSASAVFVVTQSPVPDTRLNTGLLEFCDE